MTDVVSRVLTYDQVEVLLRVLGLKERPVTKLIIEIDADRVATLYTSEHLKVDLRPVLAIIQETFGNEQAPVPTQGH